MSYYGDNKMKINKEYRKRIGSLIPLQGSLSQKEFYSYAREIYTMLNRMDKNKRTDRRMKYAGLLVGLTCLVGFSFAGKYIVREVKEDFRSRKEQKQQEIKRLLDSQKAVYEFKLDSLNKDYQNKLNNLEKELK